MKKIVLGKKFTDTKHDFRETCFGICEKDGLILLTKNNKKNEISLVGGGVEKGESHLECLKREFLEESGYTLLSCEELCAVDCFWMTRDKSRMESLANFYVVKISDKALKPSEDGHEALWASIESVEQMLPLPYHKEGLKQYWQYRKKNK